METGTGKTYVYLRTIFELNQQYSFTKFIIVVPSIAIKEGTYKSLEMTKEHFETIYNKIPYDYFVYDSSNLEQVRNFATNENLQIMIINIDAFNKSFKDPQKEEKANIIHRNNDKLSGNKPIDLIKETNPIVIIDEPQSVSTTTKAKEAIASLNPMCVINYSATHKEKNHAVYKLDAIDAYELELVKQIEVAGFETVNSHNQAYVKLVSVSNTNNKISARLEIDIQNKDKITRKVVTVAKGIDLFEKSNRRQVYEGYEVGDISCEKGKEFVSFTKTPEVLQLKQAIGTIDDDIIKEQQIYKTVEEHLDKELRYINKGIKVLSLFFVDKVANYRVAEGKGKYAIIFERAYNELIQREKYQSLVVETDAEKVHGGYFAVDKKTGFKDTTGKTLADADTYTLIMKDKERLLNLDEPLRFIFSHSALREGWDNPNVFQICTLNDSKSDTKKRQEIGRGLRLCVNQHGERVHGFEINTLTVMANESYEDFAQGLQKEIENDEGIRFGVIEKNSFMDIGGLDLSASIKIYTSFKESAYINKEDKVTEILRADLNENKLKIPEQFEPVREEITQQTKKICGKINCNNFATKHVVKLNNEVYLSEEFKQLWEKIKYKTTYSIEFDTNELINICAAELKKQINVGTAKLMYKKGVLEFGASGIESVQTEQLVVGEDTSKVVLPDILTFLQNKTDLTRNTLVEILTKSGTLKQFEINAQRYMDDVAKILVATMQVTIVDGIKYTKIEDSYEQTLFETRELLGYMGKNLMESNKSVYEHIVYDSDVEKDFATQCENLDCVQLYTKLPNWFKIKTPLGNYNPDWAIVINDNDKEHVYFVVETKGNVLGQSLRAMERAKVHCGKEHFSALGVEFKATTKLDDILE
ncbi:MAG: type III restriction endonuclease subunit R [Epulopiscium sp. Nuni2H_MBin001]|nr:MAG: type III restriction endonuclease subunit R [Epulopiscium sp. Nuni2H_MBin001]